MAIETTYSNARNNLASLLAQVTDDREIVVINRRGQEDVAMVSASELSSLLETAHLLRSPKNAQRLLKALNRAQAKTQKPSSIENLRKEFGVEKRKEK
jgi:antitoxin YefM